MERERSGGFRGGSTKICRWRPGLLGLLLIVLAPVAAPARAATPRNEDAKLVASDAASNQGLGKSVSTDGVSIAVGAPDSASAGAAGAGKVYLFQEPGGGWSGTVIESAQLTACVPHPNFRLGTSIGLDAGICVAGAVYANLNALDEGAALGFTEPVSGWADVCQPDTAWLDAPDGVADDRLGTSSATSGAVSVFGAPKHNHSGLSDAGAAYVFRNGLFEAKLTGGMDSGSVDNLGVAVSASGNTIMVGAPVNTSQFRPGAVYVFEHDGMSWTRTQRLTAPDSANADQFGWWVEVSGDVAIVGKPTDSSSAGAAYVFTYDGAQWVFGQKLIASDAHSQDAFGGRVSVDGDLALIGASLDDDQGDASGSAYVFRRDDNGTPDPGDDVWLEACKLLPTDGSAFTYFGTSVSLRGNLVVVGRSGDPAGGSYSGSAYAFVLGPECGFSPVTAAGSVPDGYGGASIPLTVTDAGGGAVDLSWGDSCGAGDTDYAVYQGTIGDFTSHAPLLCSTGGATSATVVPTVTDAYFLIVAASPDREGSYGLDSSLGERPASTSACLPQLTASCQ